MHHTYLNQKKMVQSCSKLHCMYVIQCYLCICVGLTNVSFLCIITWPNILILVILWFVTNRITKMHHGHGRMNFLALLLTLWYSRFNCSITSIISMILKEEVLFFAYFLQIILHSADNFSVFCEKLPATTKKLPATQNCLLLIQIVSHALLIICTSIIRVKITKTNV